MTTVSSGTRRAPITAPGMFQRAGDYPPAAPFERVGEPWWHSALVAIGFAIAAIAMVLAGAVFR